MGFAEFERSYEKYTGGDPCKYKKIIKYQQLMRDLQPG